MSNGYIQWRYEGGTWSNLLDLSTLTGAADGQDRMVRMAARMVRTVLHQSRRPGWPGTARTARTGGHPRWFVSTPRPTSGRCPTITAPPGPSLGVSATGPDGPWDGQDGQDGRNSRHRTQQRQ